MLKLNNKVHRNFGVHHVSYLWNLQAGVHRQPAVSHPPMQVGRCEVSRYSSTLDEQHSRGDWMGSGGGLVGEVERGRAQRRQLAIDRSRNLIGRIMPYISFFYGKSTKPSSNGIPAVPLHC